MFKKQETIGLSTYTVLKSYDLVILFPASESYLVG